jgi:hypothetical protein
MTKIFDLATASGDLTKEKVVFYPFKGVALQQRILKRDRLRCRRLDA